MHPNIRKEYRKIISNTEQTGQEGFLAELDLKDGEWINLGGLQVIRKGNKVYVDRSSVFPEFEGAHLHSETPELKGGCHLEILVDENLVEIFVNDGEYVITNAVYGLKKEIKCSQDCSILLRMPE